MPWLLRVGLRSMRRLTEYEYMKALMLKAEPV